MLPHEGERTKMSQVSTLTTSVQTFIMFMMHHPMIIMLMYKYMMKSCVNLGLI